MSHIIPKIPFVIPWHGMYAVIKNETREENLFWSNEDGWVDFKDCTRFFVREINLRNLPMGGYWYIIETKQEEA